MPRKEQPETNRKARRLGAVSDASSFIDNISFTADTSESHLTSESTFRFRFQIPSALSHVKFLYPSVPVSVCHSLRALGKAGWPRSEPSVNPSVSNIGWHRWVHVVDDDDSTSIHESHIPGEPVVHLSALLLCFFFSCANRRACSGTKVPACMHAYPNSVLCSKSITRLSK